VGSDDNDVYALNAATGSLLWKFTTGAQVVSSPAVVEGVVYIGSFDSNVYALDAETGTSIWNYTTGPAIVSSPAVVEGVVYVGSADSKVYALNAATGQLLWSAMIGPTGYGVNSSPAVSGRSCLCYFSRLYLASFERYNRRLRLELRVNR
jgi:outer membrane protein assembly factor BamB